MAVFRTAVKALSPAFLQDGTGERYMYIFGLLLDALMQKATEGGLARMPTKCEPSFLPLIGQDRLIPQGLTESVESYRIRLQRAFESWQLAGSARGILGQVLGYLLAKTPIVRLVSSRYSGNVADLWFITAATNDSPIEVTSRYPIRFATGDSVPINACQGNTAANGTWAVTVTGAYTFTLDGSTGNGAYTGGGFLVPPGFPTTYPPTLFPSSWDTYAAGQDPSTPPLHQVSNLFGVGAFNWDSLSPVSGSWSWYGAWLIAYAAAPQNWTDPPAWSWDGTLNATGASLTWDTIPGSWGLSVDWTVIASLRSIVGLFKSANTWVRWLIVSFDESLFDPTQPAGGGINPDGTFGRWSKIDGGVYVASRFDDAEYCDGV